MPLFIFVLGALLVDSGFHGTAKDLFGQLKSDLSGFMAFGAVVLILGGVGTIKQARPVTQALLVLVFVGFFLKNGTAIASNMKATVAASPAKADTTANAADTASQIGAAQTSSQNSSSSFSSVANDAQYVSMLAELFGG